MSRKSLKFAVFLLISGWTANLIAAIFPAEGQTLKFQVAQSFFGDRFEYSIKLDRKTPCYSVYRLDYPGHAGKEYFGDIQAYYYVPADMIDQTSPKPRPGVVCLHILGGNNALTSMFCANFATNGIPAVMFHMPLFGTRCPGGSRTKMLSMPDACRIFAKAMEVCPDDASRTIDIMRSRPEINPAKINLMGTSLGGIVAATVAARDTRLDKVILLLAGGDLRKLIGYSRETQKIRQLIDSAPAGDKIYLDKILDQVDPMSNAEQLKPLADSGRLMMVNAADDEVIPLDCSLRLAEKGGMKDKIRIIPKSGHYSAIAVLPQILPDFVSFFTDDTVPANINGDSKPLGDQEAMNNVFAQLRQLIKLTPAENCCILLDATYKINDKTSKTLLTEGEVILLRGNGRHFRISAKGDKIIGNIRQIDLGFNEFPWVVSARGTVYQGSIDSNGSGPGKYLNQKIALYQGMGFGIMDMASKGMLEPLKQWCEIAMKKDADGKRRMSIKIANKHQIDIYLKGSSATPERLVFDSRKISGEIVFRHWELDAPSGTANFNPPRAPNSRLVEVRQEELDRMIAAVLNFLVEGV